MKTRISASIVIVSQTRGSKRKILSPPCEVPRRFVNRKITILKERKKKDSRVRGLDGFCNQTPRSFARKKFLTEDISYCSTVRDHSSLSLFLSCPLLLSFTAIQAILWPRRTRISCSVSPSHLPVLPLFFSSTIPCLFRVSRNPTAFERWK